MLAVKRQAQVEQMRFIFGKLFVGAQHAQNILRGGKFRIRVVQIHAAPIVNALFHLISRRHNRRHPRDKLNRLEHDIFDRGVLRRRIICIQRKHRPREHIHDVWAGGLHNHVLGEVVRKRARVGEDIKKAAELHAVRKKAEQQKPGCFLKAITAAGLRACNQVADTVAAVSQFAVDGDLFAFAQQIAVYVADLCDPRQHTGAVGIAQAALDRKF